jgi:hypothetical protein
MSFDTKHDPFRLRMKRLKKWRTMIWIQTAIL